ncbi:PspC domain-containing protein [Nocardioides dongkuii]|uniref:PspC domain-containing protein n=1 Tax=Nocardioides dongkuii TaxID=2760089 RepID=UPI0015FC1938|nr:PspC domain-containing protein [Nocardioides dongkuii]
MTDIRQSLARQGLVRPRHDRVVAGVCAGVARRFGLTPWTVRLLFLLLLFIPGTQLVIYPVLWLLMPSEGSAAAQPPGPYSAYPPER